MTRAYSGQGARKKIRPRMCTYGQGLERLLAHTYMAGSERRNSVVVVFMGRKRNALCSSGGNGMRRVDREGCGVPQNGRNRPPTVETGVLLIGSVVEYRKTDETDLVRSKRGSCS